MSNIHPFSQAGFWDFVAGLKDRDNAQRKAIEPGNTRAIDRPRKGRKGPGRRARNDIAANDPVAPLNEMDPIPYHSAGEYNEKALPSQIFSPPYQAEVGAVTSEDNKTVADTKPLESGDRRGLGRRGQGNARRGDGAGGRRMRKVLFEDGNEPSDEEKAARAERRRLRREANGKGNGLGPQARRMRKALADGQEGTTENNDNLVEGVTSQQQQQRGGGPRGPRRRRNVEATGPRRLQSGSENLVDVSSDEKAASADPQGMGRRRGRGGLRGRGARGMKEERQFRVQNHIKGGPNKIAAILEQSTNSSNGKVGRNGNGRRGNGLGPRARKVAAFREQAELHGAECLECGRNDLGNTKRAQRKHLRAIQRETRNQTANAVQPEQTVSDNEAAPAVDSGLTPRQAKRQSKKFGPKKLNRNNNNKAKKARKNKGGSKFKPRADVFETDGSYIVHLPVPGANQKDIGVTWDTEKSVLRVAGIIQRPGLTQVDPTAVLLRAQRPVGSFKRVVKFGKKGQTVRVYENGITATLEDGILKIEAPKYDGAEPVSDAEFVEVKQEY